MMVKDPVCGMQVDEQMAMATSVYQGQTYYFCGKACQAAFEQQPESYVGGGRQAREGLRIVQSEPSRTRETPGRWRKVLVSAAALGGVVLVVLGIGEWRELLLAGTVPPEMLGRRVASTTIALALGLALIIWCLVAGMAWAGLKSRRRGGLFG